MTNSPDTPPHQPGPQGSQGYGGSAGHQHSPSTQPSGQPPYGSPQGYQQQGYQHQGYGGPTPYGGQPRRVEGEERTWMVLAHLSAVIAFVLSAGWLSFLGPLIIWVLKKDSSPAVRQAAAGAFNFNVTFWLLYVLGWIVAIFTLGLGFLVAIPFWIIIFLVAAWAHISGAMQASRGQTFNYPFQIPILN